MYAPRHCTFESLFDSMSESRRDKMSGRSGQQKAAAAIVGAAVAAGAAAALSAYLVSSRRRSTELTRSPLSPAVFSDLFSVDGSITDAAALFSAAQQGIEPGLRARVWPFLLHVFSTDSTEAQRGRLLSELDASYAVLLGQAEEALQPQQAAADTDGNGGGADEKPAADDRVPFKDTQRSIVMDVLRTDFHSVEASGVFGPAGDAAAGDGSSAPICEPPDADSTSPYVQEALAAAHYLTPATRRQAMRLVNLLSAHAVYDPDLGYAQGMSDFAAVFLHVFQHSDSLAFWCFQHMMQRVRENFRHDERGIRQQLRQVSVMLADVDPALLAGLAKLRCADCMFIYRMVVVLLIRDLPLQQAVQLWEIGWADASLHDSLILGADAIAPAAITSAWQSSGADNIAGVQPSLLLCFVLAVICEQRRAVLEDCDNGDDVFCLFAAGDINFDRMLRKARRLQREL